MTTDERRVLPLKARNFTKQRRRNNPRTIARLLSTAILNRKTFARHSTVTQLYSRVTFDESALSYSSSINVHTEQNERYGEQNRARLLTDDLFRKDTFRRDENRPLLVRKRSSTLPQRISCSHSRRGNGRLFHALKFPLLYTNLRTEPARGFENDRPAGGVRSRDFVGSRRGDNERRRFVGSPDARLLRSGTACETNEKTTTTTTMVTTTGETWPVMFVTGARRS